MELGMRLIVVAALTLALAGCLTAPPEATPPASDVQGGGESPPVSTTPSTTSSAPPPSMTPAAKPGNETAPTAINATPPPPPGPKPIWGDPQTAPIYPGVYLSTGWASCTSNFLFTSQDNHRIFLGTAAHCFGGSNVRTDDVNEACSPTVPLVSVGSPVRFIIEDGQVQPFAAPLYVELNGTLAYLSWQTMREVGEEEHSLTCGTNDFALVEIPLEAQRFVTPYFRPGWLATHVAEPSNLTLLTEVNVYGHSHAWQGQDALHEAWGYVTVPTQESVENWMFGITLNRPSIPGDSGSAVVTSDGRAAGILVTGGAVMDAPIVGGGMIGPGTNGAVTLQVALDYLHAHTDLRVKLAEP
jgi:hypothetical protein